MRKAIETGDIFFLYTPRPGVEEVRGLPDVYEVAFVLSPDGDHPRRLLVLRGITFPTPSSPEVAGGQQAVADVVEVRRRPEELVDALEGRVLRAGAAPKGIAGAARPCGEGRYSLSVHDDHTHLSYALELPDTPGRVQRELGLAKDASYRVMVRVPVAIAPPSPAVKPGEFMPVGDVGLLDMEGSELLLQPGMEPDAPMAVREAEGPATAEIFGELKLTRARHPTEPLYEGIWR